MREMDMNGLRHRKWFIDVLCFLSSSGRHTHTLSLTHKHTHRERERERERDGLREREGEGNHLSWVIVFIEREP